MSPFGGVSMKFGFGRGLVLGVVLGCCTTAAQAAGSGFYVSGEGGGSLLPELRLKGTTDQNEGFDGGYIAGGAFGYNTGFGIRIELNSLYQYSGLSKLDATATTGHLSTTGVMLNTMWEFLPDEHFTPYVGVGIGMQSVGGQIGTLRGRAWKPAYQGEIGLRQDLSRHFELFGEYRYTQSESVRMSNTTTTAHQHFEDNALFAGFRIALY